MQTVFTFSHHFARELAEDLRIRLIYNGQELRQDGRTLESYNVLDNSVVHCLLTSVPQQPPPPAPDVNPAPGNQADADLSRFCLPLFAFIVVSLWYCRIVYKQYFNAMSTISLIGLTFLFVVVLLASRRNGDVHEHID